MDDLKHLLAPIPGHSRFSKPESPEVQNLRALFQMTYNAKVAASAAVASAQDAYREADRVHREVTERLTKLHISELKKEGVPA